MLPLVVHCYGCKDNIHELHRVTGLPTLPQVLFDHRRTPPYWTIGDWQPSSAIEITTLPRFALSWTILGWGAWTYDPEQHSNTHLVTPLHCGLSPRTLRTLTLPLVALPTKFHLKARQRKTAGLIRKILMTTLWKLALKMIPVSSPLSTSRAVLRPSFTMAQASLVARLQTFPPIAWMSSSMSGFSAGSYTAFALEAEYRLLARRLNLDFLPGGTAVGSLGCPLLCFLALLCPSYNVGLGCLTTQERYLRILHIQEDQLCPWVPTMEALLNITTPNLWAAHPPPIFTLQYIAKGRVEWLDHDTHCYAHLLRVALSPTPSLLAVHANLEDLCAYSNSYLPLTALEELTAYLLSSAASCSPFPLLTPDKLCSGGDSNIGALLAAETLLGTRVALTRR